MVENIERYGGEFGNSGAVIKYVLNREGLISETDYEQMDDATKKISLKKSRDQYLAISFLLGGTC